MRRHLQALFVLFHCGVVAVLSIPPPPPGMQGKPGHAEVADAVVAWAEAADAVGIDGAWFTSTLHRGSALWATVLTGVQGPLRPYATWTGAHQSWRMFGVVPSRAAQLEIDVLRDGDWQPLYRTRSPDHDWAVTLLEQERMRALVGTFGSRRRRSLYNDLAAWLVGRARAEGLAGDKLRLRMREVTIPDPATLRETGSLELGSAYWSRELAL